MGIVNLNELIGVFAKNQHNDNMNFKNIIIDGNNMIISALNSAKKSMKDEYGVTTKSWNGYTIDLIQQSRYLLFTTYKIIINELERFAKRFNTANIWFVVDPYRTNYKIDLDTFTLFDKEYFEEEFKNFIKNEKERMDKEQEKQEKDEYEDEDYIPKILSVDILEQNHIILYNIKQHEQETRATSRQLSDDKCEQMVTRLINDKRAERIKRALEAKREAEKELEKETKENLEANSEEETKPKTEKENEEKEKENEEEETEKETKPETEEDTDSTTSEEIEYVETEEDKKENNLLSELFKQSFGYDNQQLINCLTRIIQKALMTYSGLSLDVLLPGEKKDFLNNSVELSNNYLFYFVQSVDEADLVIKNICKTLSYIYPNDNILVSSMDADYNILLADIKQVYISGLHCYNACKSIISPYTMWKDFFKPITDKYDNVNIYNYLIRLAPIFGNDYTGKTKIFAIPKGRTSQEITDDFNLNVLAMFDTDIENKNGNRTNAFKFIEFERQNINHNGLIRPEDFDKLIKNYCKRINNKTINLNYYGSYLYSVVVYYNYSYFRDYKSSTRYHSSDELLGQLFSINRLGKRFKTLYSFEYNKDINKMITSIKPIKQIRKWFMTDFTKYNYNYIDTEEDNNNYNNYLSQLSDSDEDNKPKENDRKPKREFKVKTIKETSKEDFSQYLNQLSD